MGAAHMCLCTFFISHCLHRQRLTAGKAKPSDVKPEWDFQQFSSGRGFQKILSLLHEHTRADTHTLSQSGFHSSIWCYSSLEELPQIKPLITDHLFTKNCQRWLMPMLTPELSAADRTEWNAKWVMTVRASCQAVPHSQCCCLMLLWIIAEEDVSDTVTLDLWSRVGHSSFQRSFCIQRAESASLKSLDERLFTAYFQKMTVCSNSKRLPIHYGDIIMLNLKS